MRHRDGRLVLCFVTITIVMMGRALPAFGQEMLFARYDITNGLPSNYLTDIEQDRKGFIWIGSDKGLSVYNGRTFSTFSSDNGLPGSLVLRLRAHPREGMIALLYGGNLVFVTKEGVQQRLTEMGPGERFSDFVVTSRGDLILISGTGIGLLNIQTGSHLILSETGSDVPSSPIFAVGKDVFIVQRGNNFFLISPYSEETVKKMEVEGIPATILPSLHIISSENDVVLLSDMTGGYYQCAISDYRIVPAKGFTGLFTPTDAAMYRKHWIIVSEYYGVQSIDPDIPLSARNVSGISNIDGSMFRDVLIDRDSTLWLAGFGTGLFKLRVEGFETLQKKSALNITYDGVLCWIFSENSFSIIDPVSNVRTEISQPDLSFHALRNVFRSSDGERWFGSYRFLYGPHYGRSIDSVGQLDKRVISDGISGIAKNENAEIIYSTFGGGIRKVQGDNSVAFRKLPTQMIERLKEINGEHWFLTFGNGLGKLVGDSAVIFNKNNGLPSDYVYDLAEFDSVLYAGTNSGLAYAHRNGLSSWHPVFLPGSSDTKIVLVFERNGRILAVGDHHLFVLSENRLEKRVLPPLSFNDREHIISAFYLPATDELWLNTTQAVRTIPLHAYSEEPLVSEVFVDKVSFIGPDGTLMESHNDSSALALPYHFSNLMLSCSVLDFKEEDQRKLFYSLNNGPFLEAPGNRIFFQRLSPGTYSLVLGAGYSDAHAVAVGKKLKIQVKAPFWQTGWFIATAITLIVSMVYLLSRQILAIRFGRRLKQLEMEHRLQKERNRIARELHDSVGASLTYIITRLDDLSTKPAKEKDVHLKQLGNFSRSAMNQLRETIWAINKESVSAKQLSDKIYGWSLNTLGNSFQLEFKSEGTLENVKLSPNQTLNCFRIVQEALQNVQKHSGAKRVDVDCIVENDVLKFVIRDDGKGFNPEILTVSESYGIQNMKTRSSEIGASLTIETGEKGTCVQLAMRV